MLRASGAESALPWLGTAVGSNARTSCGCSAQPNGLVDRSERGSSTFSRAKWTGRVRALRLCLSAEPGLAVENGRDVFVGSPPEHLAAAATGGVGAESRGSDPEVLPR